MVEFATKNTFESFREEMKNFRLLNKKRKKEIKIEEFVPNQR